MLSLNWPIVLVTTVVLYVLIILTLPFNAIYATLFLFALIACWSRLPGAGIPDPTWILYNLDLVDLFSLVIAVNIGGPTAAVFVIFANIIPRFSGSYPAWIAVLYDTGSQAIVCLIIPFVHVATGGNIFLSIMIYTTLRAIIDMPFSYILLPRPFVRWVLEWCTALFGSYLANGIYAKFFGSFFDSLMERGAQFSWVLFLFATVVILIFAITVFGFSPKKATKGFGKQVLRIAKSRLKKKEKSTAHDDDLDELRRIRESL